MQRANHRLIGVGTYLCEGAFQALSSRSKGAERVVDPGAPVRARDEPAGYSCIVQGQPGLMQPEGNLDDVRNALAGHAFAALILEGIEVAACCQEPLLEMF